MNAIERIKRAKIAIMRHKVWCAFSGVIACGEITVDDTTPTACTDGYNVRFGEKFVGTLTDAELRLVLLHEACHKSYSHLRVWKSLWDENPKLANVAMDHFVNLSLMDTDNGEAFLAMPKIGIQPERAFRGWSVKQIYNHLKQEQEDDQDPGDGDGDGDGNGDGDGDGGFDSHDFDGAGKQSAAEQDKQAEEVQRALRQGEAVARKRGQGSGNSSALIGDLLKPKLDWRQLLRDFVQETCAGRDESTWARPNRRYLADNIYMPSMHSTTMGELVVLFDTSGSVFSGSVTQAFASEIAAIVEQVKPERVRVVYCDSAVQGEQSFEDGQFALASMRVKGGGGTDLPVTFDYIRDKGYKPQAMVVLTDGYTPFGTAPGYPVLWCITERSITAPWGITAHIDV